MARKGNGERSRSYRTSLIADTVQSSQAYYNISV